ncbi:acetamidase/formamidase family protein [Actinomadura barringtoniae]|uniref:Acetamidase/formamidase family protein n=1 Tax=Actinomadura barringtoniae TaxID=1427535 RepID=A0A939PCQ3_9ACTN|nr:acetamidase/formamidase family protein [Actinomadura barringtoniae]MBO2450221.1 acetamidase/formamidase family protein [Actinomadura barringtoniae]
MKLLQPRAGEVRGEVYLPSGLDTISWGLLPNATAEPVLKVASGVAVTIDTVSHEGLLEDQGRDPAAFFGEAGFGRADLLADAVEIAGDGDHEPTTQGPHVVTGPIAVAGAQPGDVLEVEILDLAYRAPYGAISNRHGKGALPGEYPQGGAGVVSQIATVGDDGLGRLPIGDGRDLRFPLDPFLGIMGVAPATEEPVHSVPPGPHGGNIDVRLLTPTRSARLYLPVQVPGALFYVGDPHFSMGDGEVALTAFEAPLRATLRLTVHADPAIRRLAAALATPFAETATDHLVLGLDRDLDEAVKQATRNALAFLRERHGIPGPVALAYLSAAADFRISQVVDIVKGVHCCIRKADLP